MVFNYHSDIPDIHILTLTIPLWFILMILGIMLALLVVIFFIVTFRILKTSQNKAIDREIKQFYETQQYQNKQTLFEQHIV